MSTIASQGLQRIYTRQLSWWRCLSRWAEGPQDACMYMRITLYICYDTIACMDLYKLITMLVVGYKLVVSSYPASSH